MSKEVSANLGTQRQFQRRPEGVYRAQLISRQASTGITQRADYDTQKLLHSLGLVSKAYVEELEARERREKEQATLVNAEKVFAGMSKEDLAKFDTMNYLQNASDQFDLSDNKYATAYLDKQRGKMCAMYAREQWEQNPDNIKPTNVSETLNSFKEMLDTNKDLFSDGVVNTTAYEQGYYEGAIAETENVLKTTRQKIDTNKREQAVSMANVSILNAVENGLTGQALYEQILPNMRSMELACKNPTEFRKYVSDLLKVIAPTADTMEVINPILDYTDSEGVALRDTISTFKIGETIAQNNIKNDIEKYYSMALRPDGALDYNKLSVLFGQDNIMSPSLPPAVNMKVSDGIDVNGLTPELKGALPAIGGILSTLGLGDVMEITSTRRTPEHNAEVGGVANSKHLTGDAVDIYVGDVSKAEQSAIQNSLGGYFEDVIYHNAGSGLHLHLEGYKGGLEHTADNKEPRGLAYVGKYGDKVLQGILQKDALHKRMKQEEKQAVMNSALQEIAKTGSYSGAIDIIDGLNIDAVSKKELERKAMTFYNTSSKGVNGGAQSKELVKAEEYFTPKGMGVPSDYELDLLLIDKLKGAYGCPYKNVGDAVVYEQLPKDKLMQMSTADRNAYIKAVENVTKNLKVKYNYTSPVTNSPTQMLEEEEVPQQRQQQQQQNELPQQRKPKGSKPTDTVIKDKIKEIADSKRVKASKSLEDFKKGTKEERLKDIRDTIALAIQEGFSKEEIKEKFAVLFEGMSPEEIEAFLIMETGDYIE